ncbi:GH18 domain-containing protein [Caenorhabditis elegans]|uniref:GH18 domain-containing protein n=1 Tax=Caenorhabditis elegans TaxID=6239 RepID=Q17837_CAEEL|nr:GH18 domain-containing protein [Caenorhabditis elegans]CAA91150.1 GH18 domain-containing protein [Caenorhabditis elegans]|eukprot:NP_496128.1 CHItinase-Like [Caenorhabditis elegans]
MNSLNTTYNPLLKYHKLSLKTRALTQGENIVKPCVILVAIILISTPFVFVFSKLIILACCKCQTVSTSINALMLNNSTTSQHALKSNETISPPAALCGKRIVGYFAEFENSGLTRRHLQMVTHIIYLFARPTNGVMTLDGERTRRKFQEMRSKAREVSSTVKVMISVGGHDHSGAFSAIMSNEASRSVFIKSIVSFVKNEDIDGIEIFWMWPKHRDVNNYSIFIQDLRNEFTELQKRTNRKNEYIISLLVPKKSYWSFDFEDFLKFVDFFNIYSTQFREKQVGPDSPLYGGEGRNIDETMKYYTCKTGQPSKFNIFVSFHGTFWKDAELPLRNDFDDIFKDKNLTKGAFAVRWRELLQQKWNLEDIKFHNLTKTSYIWIPGPPTWFMTLEDKRSLREKTKYVADYNIGGITMWTIDQDDDDHTLLKVVSSAELCTGKEKNEINYKCD